MNQQTGVPLPRLAAVPEGAPRSPDLGGLLALVDGAERPLPLVSVTVRAHIAGDGCRTVIEQRFHNGYALRLEAVHLFPLPPNGAVVEMELRAGDTVVRAECRERQAAEAAFDQARSAGHRAALLTAERADVHTLRVTNLPPNTDVTVRMVVIERLGHADGAFLWRFPTVIAPRYLSGTPIGGDGPGVLPDTDHVPDASRLQPPLRLAGGARLDLEVLLDGPVASVASSLHAVRLDLVEPAGAVRIAPAGSATLDRDFVLSFRTGAPAVTAARAWTDGAHTLVVLEPPAELVAPAMARDAVFVLDRSGSMGGRKMAAARLAVRTALHGLSAGDRFLLLAFDNELVRFSAGYEAYTDEAVTRAEQWLASVDARGGTEMLPAVRAALAGESVPGRLRTVLLITDGEAWNDAELVAAVAHRRGAARFFTLGIDPAVNEALLRRLARVGGGTCELLTPDDDIEAAVARLEARFGSPLATDLRCAGGESADPTPRDLFAGRPAAWLLSGAPERVEVAGQAMGGAVAYSARPVRTELALGALWARERVAALEDRLTLRPLEEDALRPEILRVALAHGIASRFTAFVAVDTSMTEMGERVEVVQPVELPYGWDPAALNEPLFARHAAAAPMSAAVTVGTARRLLGLAQAHDDRLAGTLSEWAPSEVRALGRLSEVMPGLSPSVADDSSDALERRYAHDQRADGCIGGDVAATATALAALVLLGHTRRRGKRSRVVAKAAAWLDGHRAEPAAALVLELLADAEAGTDLSELARAFGPRLAVVLPGWPDVADLVYGRVDHH